MKRISKTEIKEMRSQSKKNRIMFAFTLPTVILYTIFFLVTMLIGVYYSFTDWNGISKDYTFVGLKNYVKVLTDERFREALWFNIGYTIALVVLLIVIPLTIALALNRIRRLSTLFRSIYFIPAVISMVTVGLIWNELFYRAVPAIGEMLNIEALSTSPLGNPKLAAIAIMVVNIWQGCAIPTVLFIAGLQSVPKDLLEAATIDGAGNWARFWNVIIPYLIPVLNMVIITQAKAGLTVFDYIKVMTNGGPAQSTEAVVMEYPEDRSARNVELEYFLGDSLLVVPVFDQEDEIDVYLPNGQWIDLFTHERIKGGRWVKRKIELDKIPVFIRQNKMIPMLTKIPENIEEKYENLDVILFCEDEIRDTYIDDGNVQNLKAKIEEGTLFINTDMDASYFTVYAEKCLDNAVVNGQNWEIKKEKEGYYKIALEK